MPALNNENPPNERGFICRTIEEWIDLYGMSPPKRHALDKVPPTLQCAAMQCSSLVNSTYIDSAGPLPMALTAGYFSRHAS